MAREVRQFIATIPHGTLQSAPVFISVSFDIRIVRRIHWRVPRGPQGTMGWLLAMGQVPVLPLPAGTYVVADGESGTWEVHGQPDSGAWQVQGYNTGANDHSVHLAFELDLVERPPSRRLAIPLGQLAEVPDLSKAGPPIVAAL